MRHLLTALLLLAGSAAAAADCGGENLIAAQGPELRARLDAAAAGVPHAEGVLWSAEGPGDTHLTVIGTLHVYDPREEALIARLRGPLAQADLLVVEATQAATADMQRRIAEEPQISTLTEGPSLLTLLGPEDWAVFAEKMRERGVPPFFAAKFKPWYAALTLSFSPCMAADIRAKRLGIDHRLMQIAAERGLPVAGLDDVDALLAMLSGDPPERQLAELRAGLRLDALSGPMLTTMTDSYFAGRNWESWNFFRYADLGLAPEDKAIVAREFERMQRDLLDGRNRAWIDLIPDLIRGKRAVLAVGAAHLPGKTGILSLLEARGFTVTPLAG